MKIYLSLALLFLNFVVISQGTVTVTGQVKDDDTKENISFSKVVVMDMKDSIISGAYTDDDGFFSLHLTPNAYRLVISSFGYQNDTIQPKVYREDQFLGIIRLKGITVEVGEVVVEASGRIDKLDRDVQIITDDLKEGTTAAKDVLNKISGITYDQYTGVIKVDGDANIKILVNGVEKNQEYVQNLDPERLLKVETIRDPGGRYGLEGYSSVINIVLRNDYVGTEVYVEGMSLVDINTDKGKLDFLIGSLGVTYNYTKNKVNFYASARPDRKQFQIFSQTETTYDDGISILESAQANKPNIEILQYSANYTLGLDYQINPKHTISFENYTSALPQGLNLTDLSYQTQVFDNEALTQQYEFRSRIRERELSTYNTVFYIGNFDEKNKLNVSFTHSYNRDIDTINSVQEDVYERIEDGKNQKHFTRFNAEYDKNLGPKADVQFGIGNTFSWQNNLYHIFQIYTGVTVPYQATTDFTQTDLRNRAYVNYSYRFNPKWGVRFGLAAENSIRKNPDQRLNFYIAQPLFDLRYFANDKFNFNLKYRADTDYPGIDEMNPFFSLVNPRVTSIGNPNLRPTIVHRFSLRVNLWKGLFSLEPYSHVSTNLVAKVGSLDSANIFNFHYENAELFQKHGVKLNFNKYFKFNVLIQGNLDLYSSTITSSEKMNNIMDWRGDMDLIYIFPKSQMLVGAKYQREQSMYNNAMGYEKGDVDFWMLFYKTPLFKQRASILLGYFLPIDLGVNYNQDSEVSNTGFRMHSDNDVSLVKNMFLLEFSYRFNKGKSVKRLEKNVEKEEEEKGGLF